MPSLGDHQSGSYVKLVYIGDSGTGKTGSLVSLVKDGYKLKVLDMDNGLDSLAHFVRNECPENLNNIEFETIRDVYVSTKMGPIVRASTAFIKAMEQLTTWAKVEDSNSILVVDSLSALGKAAFEWAKGMNPGAKDPRQWYFAAQGALENVVALLTSEELRQNVIVISHVNYKEVTEGVTKGHINAVGSALGPIIARYFNTLILAESTGSGTNTRRRIKTVPTGIIDLKNPNPVKIEPILDLGTGLSTIFKTLKGQ